MKRKENTGALTLLVLAGVVSGCQRSPEGWTPVLEETSTAFLEAETGRALDQVRTAREAVAEDPASVEDALRAAETSLEHLLTYYLPLVQARERAYNAYREFFLSDEDRVVQELSRIEDLLEGMAEAASDAPLPELQALAEVLADARLAIEGRPEEARTALETLARRLNQAALKGDLILRR
jgi:hypothetical protein